MHTLRSRLLDKRKFFKWAEATQRPKNDNIKTSFMKDKTVKN